MMTSRGLSKRLAMGTFAFAASLLLIGTPVAASAYGTADGLDVDACKEYVAHPQILPQDKTADGRAVTTKPAEDGTYTPVVVVHGWNGGIKHESRTSSSFSLPIDRYANGAGGVRMPQSAVHNSMMGTLQSVPGAQVYTFDYSAVNARWVTNPQIAPKLAKGIRCLTKLYGNKAVVVGHSMGGLALRQALSLKDETGKPVSDSVAHAITFGTPNEGTTILKFGYDALDTMGHIPGLITVTAITKALMKKCADGLDSLDGKGYCAGGLLYSEGAQAMLPGSKEISALPAFPSSVKYTALAGDIQLGGITFFGKKTKRLIDAGDLAVNHSSAVAKANDQLTAQCEYGIISLFSPRRGVSIGEWLRGYRNISLLSIPGEGRALATPCFHNNLMSERSLAAKMEQEVRATIAKPHRIEAGETVDPRVATQGTVRR